jgi:hypothetical protein
VGECLVNSLSKRIGQAISQGQAEVAHPALKEADHHAGDPNAVRQSLLVNPSSKRKARNKFFI